MHLNKVTKEIRQLDNERPSSDLAGEKKEKEEIQEKSEGNSLKTSEPTFNYRKDEQKPNEYSLFNIIIPLVVHRIKDAMN